MVCGHCQKCREPYVKSFQTMGMRLMFPRIERGCFFPWRFQKQSETKRVSQRQVSENLRLQCPGSGIDARSLVEADISDISCIYLVFGAFWMGLRVNLGTLEKHVSLQTSCGQLRRGG